MGITFPASAANYNQTKKIIVSKIVNVRKENIHRER